MPSSLIYTWRDLSSNLPRVAPSLWMCLIPSVVAQRQRPHWFLYFNMFSSFFYFKDFLQSVGLNWLTWRGLQRLLWYEKNLSKSTWTHGELFCCVWCFHGGYEQHLHKPMKVRSISLKHLIYYLYFYYLGSYVTFTYP